MKLLLAQADPSFVEGDLSTRGHFFILVATAVALILILRLVRRRQLAGKYALLWTIVAGFLGVLAIWPGLLSSISDLVGVHYPVDVVASFFVGLGAALVVTHPGRPLVEWVVRHVSRLSDPLVAGARGRIASARRL